MPHPVATWMCTGTYCAPEPMGMFQMLEDENGCLYLSRKPARGIAGTTSGSYVAVAVGTTGGGGRLGVAVAGDTGGGVGSPCGATTGGTVATGAAAIAGGVNVAATTFRAAGGGDSVTVAVEAGVACEAATSAR